MSTRTPSKINPLASLYSDLITIIENSVIKYSVEAEKNETLEVRKYSDRYLDALSKKDSFHVYEYTTELVVFFAAQHSCQFVDRGFAI